LGAQYFTDWVLDTLPDLIGPMRGEFVVETTLHLPFQRAAEQAVEGALAARGDALSVSQAALISIDRDGAIRAMVGGRSYGASQFNRSTQARRQPGSAFKPFVFLAALEHGRTPLWRVSDASIEINGWRPANFTRRGEGEVTLAKALAESINTVAVRLGESVGREAVIETAKRLGITSSLKPVASLALGTQEVTLLELTGAYLPFVTGGEMARIHGIERVTTRQGRVLYSIRSEPRVRVVTGRDAGAMNAMLREVLAHGTGARARISDRDAAGKTGTSSDFRDAWFVGYTADLVTGVWVGNDDGSPMRGVTGGGLPAEIWRAYMARAASVYPSRPLPDGGYAPLTPTEIAEGGGEERYIGFFERISSFLGKHAHDRVEGRPAAPQAPPPTGSAN
jgi:penicillin-binding protein 1A